jgi:hypothetical protein
MIGIPLEMKNSRRASKISGLASVEPIFIAFLASEFLVDESGCLTAFWSFLAARFQS